MQWAASYDYTHGKWRQAKVRLWNHAPVNSPYDAPNTLAISFPDSTQSLEPIYIYQLHQSDIRRTHYSVFCENHVIGIHRRTGRIYGVPPPPPPSYTSPNLLRSSVANAPPRSPWVTIPAHHLQPQGIRLDASGLSSAHVSRPIRTNATYPPIYIKFPSGDLHDAWFTLFHAYARPESFVNGFPSLPSFAEEAVQHRKWRGLSLKIDWIDGMDGFEEGGVREGPVSSSSKDSLSGSLSVDFDFYCDILLDGLLVGRTTIKRWKRTEGAPMRVDWHEHFDMTDLPALGNLQLLIWKMKAEKERTPTHSGMHPDSQRQRLTSSISAGVAFIGHAVGFGHKERGRTCIGQIQVPLSDFPRNETVDGKWEVTALGSRIPWRIGPALTMWLKLKVDDCDILPLKAYAELASFLKPTETFLLLDQSCFVKGKGTYAFDKTCLPTLQRCVYDLSVEDDTILDDASHLLKMEIASIHEKTLAHPGSTVNNTLFRSGAIHCKVVELIMTTFGRDWLINSLGHLVQDVISDKAAAAKSSHHHHHHHGKSEKKSGAASPGFEHGGVNLKSKVDDDVLISWCNKAWCDIWNARDQCPEYLRQIFHTIRSEVDNRFNPKPARRLYQVLHSKPRKDYSTSATAEDSPDYTEADETGETKYEKFRFQVLSGFAFLRFFSPALLNPHLYYLSNGRLDDTVGDILKDVARALQQLANLSKGHSTEVFLQSFSNKYANDMVDYLQSISTVVSGSSQPVSSKPQPTESSTTLPNSKPQINPAVKLLERATQNRLGSVPPLHQESVPTLPHLIDAGRCLATIASIVGGHLRDDDTDDTPGSNSMAAQWRNFRHLCLRVEERRLRACRIDTGRSPEEEESSYHWAVDEAFPDSPQFGTPQLESTDPEPIQQQDEPAEPVSPSNPPAVEPSPAISQISTFTSSSSLSGVLGYYLRDEAIPEVGPSGSHSYGTGHSSNAQPSRGHSTAPTLQRVSQFPTLPTTFEADTLAPSFPGSAAGPSLSQALPASDLQVAQNGSTSARTPGLFTSEERLPHQSHSTAIPRADHRKAKGVTRNLADESRWSDSDDG
ncbi:hypothetical protein FRB90_002338 [Tulasnella sp. 427]|nr:hypothetical protein FRB90_002338 [Tulasnella sp. 427]